VQLRPDGVAFSMNRLPRFVPWEALAPVAATQVAGYLFDYVRLDVARPELIPRRRWWGPRSRIRIPYDRVDIHPLFLAPATVPYVRRPDRRSPSGGAAEREGLRAELWAVAATTGASPSSWPRSITTYGTRNGARSSAIRPSTDACKLSCADR